MRVNSYELSHLILRFEQEKDMKPMHCVQNLAALRDLVDLRIEVQRLKEDKEEYARLMRQACKDRDQLAVDLKALQDKIHTWFNRVKDAQQVCVGCGHERHKAGGCNSGFTDVCECIADAEI